MLEYYEFAYKVGLLVNVLAMIICPIVAHNKGRSAIAWFFWGFLLGGLGIIIICCIRDGDRDYKSKSNSKRIYTPDTDTNSIKEYYAIEKEKQKNPKYDANQKWKCPICGKENSMGEEYCIYCLADRPK